jgi:hypothetical protein
LEALFGTTIPQVAEPVKSGLGVQGFSQAGLSWCWNTMKIPFPAMQVTVAFS